MAKYETLNDAMVASDALAEAEMRYALLSATFTDMPQMQSQLNKALTDTKAEIMRLRATKPAAPSTDGAESGKVVAFDASRFRKSG